MKRSPLRPKKLTEAASILRVHAHSILRGVENLRLSNADNLVILPEVLALAKQAAAVAAKIEAMRDNPNFYAAFQTVNGLPKKAVSNE